MEDGVRERVGKTMQEYNKKNGAKEFLRPLSNNACMHAPSYSVYISAVTPISRAASLSTPN